MWCQRAAEKPRFPSLDYVIAHELGHVYAARYGKEFQWVRAEDVPREEVESYYRQHERDFNKPEQVRVSEIVIKDEHKALRVAAEARAARKTHEAADQKAFAALVSKSSEDPSADCAAVISGSSSAA
jgi:hypothetical protein